MDEAKGAALWQGAVRGVWVAWLLFMTMSSVPYGTIESILEPIGLYMLGSFALLIAAVALGRLPVFDRVAPVAGWSSYVSAALACCAIVLVQELPNLSTPLLVVAALASAVSCGLFVADGFNGFVGVDPLTLARSVMEAVAWALGIQLLLALLIDAASIAGALSVLLGLLALWMRSCACGSGGSEERETMGAARGRQVPYLLALIATSAFLLAYELNGTQKTLHFPQLSEGAAFCVGPISGVALLAIALFLVVLGCLIRAGLRRNFVTMAAIAVVGLCVTFFFLNHRTPVLFLLLFPFGAVTCMASVFKLILVARGWTRAEGIRLIGYAGGAFAVGCLLGSGCAYAVLSLRDQLEFYDMIFTWLPAVLVLACVVIAACMVGKAGENPLPLRDTGSSDEPLPGGQSCLAVALRCGLTPREEDVLRLLAQGRSAPAIADMLSVQVSTVKSHIAQIYRKAGVNTRQELIDLLHAEG